MVTYTSSNTSDSVADQADQAAQSADAAIKSTQRLANAALENLSEETNQLRASALRASDSTVKYIQHDPVKAILIAAATGAALMALAGLIGRALPRK